MSRSIRVCALFCLIGLLPVAVVFGQQQQGAIFGAVSDASGALVPGVGVEISGPNLIRPLSAVTDEYGAYRFPALPPGIYQIKSEMPGFATYIRDGIELNVGRALKVDIQLKVSEIAETVEVSATAAIDVVKSESAQVLNDQLLAQIPKGRDYRDIAKALPGINEEKTGINVDGASGSENVYFIDGIDTTDMYSGTTRNQVPMDFVGELQIKTGGYEAEYGGAMGGVISVVTKSGSNSLHGEAVYNYWGDKLTGANRDRLRINPIDDMTAEYMEGEPKDPSRKQEIGFSLSGPVLKDRLWFFGMYLPRLELTQRDVTFITDGQTRHYERDEKTHSALIKLSSQVGQKLSLAGSYGLDWNKYLGELPRRDGTDSPEDNWTEKGARRPAYTVSTSADYMISPKFLLSGRGGYFHSDDVQLGGPNEHRWRMVGAISVFDPPESLLRPSGWQNISTGYVRSKSIRDRTNASVDGSVFLNAGGEHNLKVGYQYNRIHNDVDNAYKNDFMYFYWNRSYRSNFSNQDYRGAYGYLRLISGPETPYGEKAEVQSGRHAIFLQDSWRPTRNLSFNAGLRLEKEDIPSFSDMPEYQGTAIEFAFSEKIAPRLGAAYDVFGDSRFKVFGSWGLFYDVLKLELPNGSFGGFKWKDRYYTLETLDWKSIGGGNYTPNGGQFIEEIDWRIPSFETLDPDLKPMRMQEAIFGSEYLLGRDWVLSTRFVHKQLDRAIEDVGVETDHGEMYYITNPGYGYSVSKMIENGFPATPKAKRNYDAFEVGLNKRFTRGWSSRLNYTYSRLRGLYSGLASSDEEGRQSPNVDRDFDGWWLSRDAQMRVLDGPLQTDRPHQFKALGNYEFGWGLNLGVYQSILSGRPLTRTVDINHMETIVENRGSDGRMPFMTQTDFFVSHGFKLTEKNSLEVSFTVFNLFDQKEVTDTYRIMNRDSLAIDMVPGQPYDYKSALAAAAAEEATFLDPRFLKANGFQAPIEARFGVRFLF